MRIGYLVNQYPKISHTFIRSEIAALERGGTEVVRYSIRQSPEVLIDSEDLLEADKTRVLLREPVLRLAMALANNMSRPLVTTRAVLLASRMGIASGFKLARQYAYLAEASLLKSWAAEAGVRHIHAHFGSNSTAVAMLCKALGGPTYSFTVHGPEEFDKADAMSLARKLRHATFTVAISDFGRSQLWRYSRHSDWDKVHIIRCGVDRAFTQRPAEPIPQAPRLVCVGRLCEQKGQLLLLRAASELKKSGEDFQLVLVGDGELREVLESTIAALHLSEHVTITGWQSPEQVRQHILASRALVLPSFAEGLPVVIMEAFALCRPVISTYVAGIPELVTDRINGWLAPAGSLYRLIDAMRDALTLEPARLEEMGRHGRTCVQDRHDSDKNAEALKELFLNAVA